MHATLRIICRTTSTVKKNTCKSSFKRTKITFLHVSGTTLVSLIHYLMELAFVTGNWLLYYFEQELAILLRYMPKHLYWKYLMTVQKFASLHLQIEKTQQSQRVVCEE